MSRSAPVPSSSLKITSLLQLGMRSLNRGSSREILPSCNPDAPSVFSKTFGTCCLKTNGVNFRLRREPIPRIGLHESTVSAVRINTKQMDFIILKFTSDILSFTDIFLILIFFLLFFAFTIFCNLTFKSHQVCSMMSVILFSGLIAFFLCNYIRGFYVISPTTPSTSRTNSISISNFFI